jgi:hypothetical protein
MKKISILSGAILAFISLIIVKVARFIGWIILAFAGILLGLMVHLCLKLTDFIKGTRKTIQKVREHKCNKLAKSPLVFAVYINNPGENFGSEILCAIKDGTEESILSKFLNQTFTINGKPLNEDSIGKINKGCIKERGIVTIAINELESFIVKYREIINYEDLRTKNLRKFSFDEMLIYKEKNNPQKQLEDLRRTIKKMTGQK